jgi:hypothetical protein
MILESSSLSFKKTPIQNQQRNTSRMSNHGWDQLLNELPDQSGPILAYSEFMPPPRIAWRPYEKDQPAPRVPDNPFGWLISEREQAQEIEPGLGLMAREVLHRLQRLHKDLSARGISLGMLQGNVYFPPELSDTHGPLPHERFVTLLPLALSKTQDDKGRVRWTFFGGSEQGPDRAFWKSFYTAPGEERPGEYSEGFIRRLLSGAYGETHQRLADLRKAGFRIIPGSGETISSRWRQDPLPGWTAPYVMKEGDPLENAKYILTFRPFGTLPAPVRKAYLSGRVHLIPFPGSLIFWGAPPYLDLQKALSLAMQIPLLSVCERSEGIRGLRIPQSGWMHEPREGGASPVRGAHKWRNTYRRTHRWEHLERHKDELGVVADEDHVAHVLFSSEPIDIDLYNKPMARNSQIWTRRYELLLDGPGATRKDLIRAAAALREGGEFGYRFFSPPMIVGSHEIFWHLPLVAFLDPKTRKPHVLEDAPLGYLTAYDKETHDLDSPVELWPVLGRRPELMAGMRGYSRKYEHKEHQDALNAGKLIGVSDFFGEARLPSDFARSILNVARNETAEEWIKSIGKRRSREGKLLAEKLRRIIKPQVDQPDPPPSSLTYDYTANRQFEVNYWNTIANLATGRFLNKENADCVDDPPTRSIRKHGHRDLEALGDWLLGYYRKTIAQCGMQGKAIAGDLPFRWETDFEFDWMGGWKSNQEGEERERDLLVVIPGRDRSRAVIMADHYDTAYMEDLYYKESGGKLARVAASGADDNHSATAALMLGAPVFLDLSRTGQLECDVWLIHLTGEEFPADCMGARHLARWLVERTLKLRLEGGKRIDLSNVRVEGVYVLDMVAHNRHPHRDVFQISPGLSRKSYLLAYQAHLANMIWNAGVREWNRQPSRGRLTRGRRSKDGKKIPNIALHPMLQGEVRVPLDPRSSLFNTDGQIFSDVGIPVVLFMENYDINRTGYHDSKDNMTNIDLDYGAAVAAIAIESVARVARSPDAPFPGA